MERREWKIRCPVFNSLVDIGQRVQRTTKPLETWKRFTKWNFDFSNRIPWNTGPFNASLNAKLLGE